MIQAIYQYPQELAIQAISHATSPILSTVFWIPDIIWHLNNRKLKSVKRNFNQVFIIRIPLYLHFQWQNNSSSIPRRLERMLWLRMLQTSFIHHYQWWQFCMQRQEKNELLQTLIHANWSDVSNIFQLKVFCDFWLRDPS